MNLSVTRILKFKMCFFFNIIYFFTLEMDGRISVSETLNEQIRTYNQRIKLQGTASTCIDVKEFDCLFHSYTFTA